MLFTHPFASALPADRTLTHPRTLLDQPLRDQELPFQQAALAYPPFMSNNAAALNWQDQYPRDFYSVQPPTQDFGTSTTASSAALLTQPNHALWNYDRSATAHDLNHAQFLHQNPRSVPAQLHRRALSNSSAGTFESSSPYTQASPLPQYAHQQYLTAPQGYPTPIHSPVADVYNMATANKRRSHSAAKTNGATTPVGGAMRSALGRSSSNVRPGSGHSVYGQDLPVTPQTLDGGDDLQDHKTSVIAKAPKFDRTMTDIYQDELYDPNQAFSATAEQAPLPADYDTNFLTPNRQVQQAVNAANQARSTSPKSLDGARDVSPFRKNSEYFGQNPSMQTAAVVRQQQKSEADRLAYQQHHTLQRQQSDQKTISPKDALLDYNAAEDSQSLFPQTVSSASESAPMYGPHNANKHPRRTAQPANFTFPNGGFATVNTNNDAAFGATNYQTQSIGGSQEQQPDFPAHLVSMETTKSEGSSADESSHDSAASPQRPADMTAGSGTYTCTYHGCYERFESPSKLQKHKREDHRSTGHSSLSTTASNNAAHNMTQAGPHRCDRINPQTGKPCNTVFSRPYDLTRHEDTIHNRQKTKVKCPYCTEEKTFSRNDALTRHLKVVHPNVPIPGKHRKSSTLL